MTKYEYCVYETVQTSQGHYCFLSFTNGKDIELENRSTISVMEELGKDGWELVSTTHFDNKMNHFFKRRLE
ncbi:DUF4177 domain-containing protein [Methanosarcina vacuolata]|uniref:DUF4177 domain-containing protein n=1 Tax=Methanosarcina vacuolata TaxID=2215 RepID=UPI00064F7CDD|nr:DUF4177 domain-containing protein [Methanosarcina vacuolata]